MNSARHVLSRKGEAGPITTVQFRIKARCGETERYTRYVTCYQNTEQYCMYFFFILAPGTYSPEKVNLNKGPQYSLSGKGPTEKPINTPGMIKL